MTSPNYTVKLTGADGNRAILWLWVDVPVV